MIVVAVAEKKKGCVCKRILDTLKVLAYINQLGTLKCPVQVTCRAFKRRLSTSTTSLRS